MSTEPDPLYIAQIKMDRKEDHCIMTWTSRYGGVEPWRTYRLMVSDDDALRLIHLPSEAVYGYILAKQCDELEVAGSNPTQ